MLARLPAVSNRNGQLELERTGNYEVGYNKVTGSMTYAVSAFYEDVSNGRINLAGNVSGISPNNLLADGISMTSMYNIGNYHRTGYLASVNPRVNSSLDFALAYGRMGGFTAAATGISETWEPRQKFLDESGHNMASADVTVRAPFTGTQFLASYGWVDAGAVVPSHAFTTQSAYVAPGLNVAVRQPLPSLFGLPGRLEVTADLRNLLAQGYIPLTSPDGQRMLIVQAPRAIRGGLNFIF